MTGRKRRQDVTIVPGWLPHLVDIVRMLDATDWAVVTLVSKYIDATFTTIDDHIRSASPLHFSSACSHCSGLVQLSPVFSLPSTVCLSFPPPPLSSSHLFQLVPLSQRCASTYSDQHITIFEGLHRLKPGAMDLLAGRNCSSTYSPPPNSPSASQGAPPSYYSPCLMIIVNIQGASSHSLRVP